MAVVPLPGLTLHGEALDRGVLQIPVSTPIPRSSPEAAVVAIVAVQVQSADAFFGQVANIRDGAPGDGFYGSSYGGRSFYFGQFGGLRRANPGVKATLRLQDDPAHGVSIAAPDTTTAWNGYPVAFDCDLLSLPFNAAATYESDVLLDIATAGLFCVDPPSLAQWVPIDVLQYLAGVLRGYELQVDVDVHFCGDPGVLYIGNAYTGGQAVPVPLPGGDCMIPPELDTGWVGAGGPSPAGLGCVNDVTFQMQVCPTVFGATVVKNGTKVRMRWTFVGAPATYDPCQTLSVAYVPPGVGEGITVHLATDSSGRISSTWKDIADAIQAATPLSAFAGFGGESDGPDGLYSGTLAGGAPGFTGSIRSEVWAGAVMHPMSVALPAAMNLPNDGSPGASLSGAGLNGVRVKTDPLGTGDSLVVGFSIDTLTVDVTLATDGGGVVTSTWQDVVDKINASRLVSGILAAKAVRPADLAEPFDRTFLGVGDSLFVAALDVVAEARWMGATVLFYEGMQVDASDPGFSVSPIVGDLDVPAEGGLFVPPAVFWEHS